jgi:hypothetical protein
LLARGLSDPHNRYPFTYVKGLLGQAMIAHRRGNQAACEQILRQALRYAGTRSLVREYADTVQMIANLMPGQAPIERLQDQAMAALRATNVTRLTAPLSLAHVL